MPGTGCSRCRANLSAAGSRGRTFRPPGRTRRLRLRGGTCNGGDAEAVHVGEVHGQGFTGNDAFNNPTPGAFEDGTPGSDFSLTISNTHRKLESQPFLARRLNWSFPRRLLAVRHQPHQHGASGLREAPEQPACWPRCIWAALNSQTRRRLSLSHIRSVRQALSGLASDSPRKLEFHKAISGHDLSSFFPTREAIATTNPATEASGGAPGRHPLVLVHSRAAFF